MADSKPSNPKDAAATNRLDLSLFPATARAYGALAMVEGDQKYGGYNYRAAGVNASIYYAAANRHLDKWYNGEENDPKTGVPHLANAIACLAVLIDGIEKGNWTDDRPPQLDLTRLLDDFEKRVGKVKEIFPRRTERYVANKSINPNVSDGSVAGDDSARSKMDVGVDSNSGPVRSTS